MLKCWAVDVEQLLHEPPPVGKNELVWGRSGRDMTWYRLWQMKCCWQNLLCSVAIPHITKLDAPQKVSQDRDLLIWTTHNGSDAQHVPQWICYSRLLFLIVLMKTAIHLFLWNKPMLCMFWTAWTKHFYLLHPKSPQCSLAFRLCPFLSCQCIFVYQSRLSAGSTGKSSIIMDRAHACVMLWKGGLNYVCIMYL